jgi:hypothetical protein
VLQPDLLFQEALPSLKLRGPPFRQFPHSFLAQKYFRGDLYSNHIRNFSRWDDNFRVWQVMLNAYIKAWTPHRFLPKKGVVS